MSKINPAAPLNPPQPLTIEHDTSAFDCGKAPLNDFLKLHALAKQNAMLSRTYVVTETTTNGMIVVGYYTLTHASVLQSETPKKLGRGMPSTIPALLMARFAVDRNWQGQGIGHDLFVDATRRTWAVMQSGAAPVRFFVVDAKDEEAKAFYERFDMITASENPLRLFFSYKTLRETFAEEIQEG